MVATDGLEAGAEGGAARIVRVGIFGLEGEDAPPLVVEEGGQTPALAIEHRDLKTVEDVRFGMVEATIVVVGAEPGALEFGSPGGTRGVPGDGLREGETDGGSALMSGGRRVLLLG